jgi:hypothetical protein
VDFFVKEGTETKIDQVYEQSSALRLFCRQKINHFVPGGLYNREGKLDEKM